jgi:glycosyltransferase involved in cell wall biosynthesis
MRGCGRWRSVASGPGLRVAVVTPWFGDDLTGGAERTAWQLAHGLAGRGHRVDVFTTSAHAFSADWGTDFHQPGARDERGVLVRRFAVDARRADAFERANDIILSRPLSYYRSGPASTPADVEDDFVNEGINSGAAIDALGDELDEFDAVLVLPYLYGLVLAAIETARSRAILVPCLHDEPYAYLPTVERAFRMAGRIVFNTHGERRLAIDLYGPAVALKSIVGGQWVEDAAPSPVPGYVPGFRTADRRYVLYLGRRDETKNVDMLVESFAGFRRRNRLSNLELVLVGPGARSYDDPHHGIRDLGFVDQRPKDTLLRDAWVVAQPSINESFSRAIFEAWNAGCPVVVSARCAATADAVRESGGGWTAATKADWSSIFEAVDVMTPERRSEAAAAGRRYAEEQGSRERILDRYEDVVRAACTNARASRFDAVPSHALVRRLADGRKTILFAGPLDERSCIEQLLTGFAFLLWFGIDARLVLAGEFDSSGPLAGRFFGLVGRAHLADRVVLFASRDPEIIAACYRSADLYWSTATDGPEREIVDALGYGVPVLAFANVVAERTLGQAGVLYDDKDDMRTLGGIAAMLVTDQRLRELIAEGQRRRFDALCAQRETAAVE